MVCWVQMTKCPKANQLVFPQWFSQHIYFMYSATDLCHNLPKILGARGGQLPLKNLMASEVLSVILR